MRTEEALENAAYALKCTTEVAIRRKNAQAVALCEALRMELDTIIIGDRRSRATLHETRRRLRWLVFDLLTAVSLKCERS